MNSLGINDGGLFDGKVITKDMSLIKAYIDVFFILSFLEVILKHGQILKICVRGYYVAGILC